MRSSSLTNCGRRRLLEDDGARKAVYRVVAPAPTPRPTPGPGGGSKGGGGGGDDAGLIAGVVVAVVVALGLGAGAWYYYTKREPAKPAKADLPSWAAEESNVVIEPVPRVARTASSQEVDELFEETTTPPGAPPAAEGDEDTFKY